MELASQASEKILRRRRRVPRSTTQAGKTLDPRSELGAFQDSFVDVKPGSKHSVNNNRSGEMKCLETRTTHTYHRNVNLFNEMYQKAEVSFY